MKQASGRFVIRIAPELHQRARRYAYERGMSLNECCAQALDSLVGDGSDERLGEGTGAQRWVKHAAEVVQEGLIGVVLFGSLARGEAGPASDIDLLIVIEESIDLEKALYEQWDELCRQTAVSPHFVHLPARASDGGSLWFEVAIHGIVLYERKARVSGYLRQIREAIVEGLIERRTAYGHAYWVWHGREAENAQ